MEEFTGFRGVSFGERCDGVIGGGITEIYLASGDLLNVVGDS